MDLRDLFQSEKRAKQYQPGSIIFEQGEPGEVMYVILEGKVALYLNGKLLGTAKAGETIGEMALVDNAPRSATAIAAVPSTLVEINEERFFFLVQQAPFFSLEVMRFMASRLRLMLGGRENGQA